VNTTICRLAEEDPNLLLRALRPVIIVIVIVIDPNPSARPFIRFSEL
jgi:hypothetical protein